MCVYRVNSPHLMMNRPLALIRFSPPQPPRKKGFVLTPLPTPLYPPDAGGGKTTKPFIYGRTLAQRDVVGGVGGIEFKVPQNWGI